MAVSEIIGAAVGVILLVIVAYVIVGGTLFAGETVANAQKDLTLQQEARMRTALSISDVTVNSTIIHANATNTGTEIIGDFKHMDVIVYDSGSSTYQYCTYIPGETASPGTWRIEAQYGEFIHPNELDPGETYRILVNTQAGSPAWFQITTANGVSASAFVK